jgi:hypothetical protein
MPYAQTNKPILCDGLVSAYWSSLFTNLKNVSKNDLLGCGDISMSFSEFNFPKPRIRNYNKVCLTSHKTIA